MSVRLSKKFESAICFATRAHDGQVRKGSLAPYISHPLAVASLVLEYAGTETQAMAALLHDVIEDCDVKETELRRRFGKEVARIVHDCTDHIGGSTVKKAWKVRKKAYLVHLASAAPQSLLVSGADKLHNARSIIQDVRQRGPVVWKRFNARPNEILWYYASLVQVFKKRAKDTNGEFKLLLQELTNALRELKRAVP